MKKILLGLATALLFAANTFGYTFEIQNQSPFAYNYYLKVAGTVQKEGTVPASASTGQIDVGGWCIDEALFVNLADGGATQRTVNFLREGRISCRDHKVLIQNTRSDPTVVTIIE